MKYWWMSSKKKKVIKPKNLSAMILLNCKSSKFRKKKGKASYNRKIDKGRWKDSDPYLIENLIIFY